MFFNEGHQEFDYEQGDEERRKCADEKIPNFGADKPASFQKKLNEFERTCPKHDGNSKKEGEFCAGRTGDAEKQCA